MRVTDNMLIEQFVNIHREIMQRLEKAAYQLSSGKRLSAPHDDPAANSQILSLRKSISEMERFLKNIDEGKAWLGLTESALSKVDEYLKRVQELTINGANDDKDASARLAIAQELDEIFDELIDMGNTKSMGRYIFAGTKTDKAPFARPKESSLKVITAGLEKLGISLETAEAFSDLNQLAPGRYRLFIKKDGEERLLVWLEDEGGNPVQIDANGSDDSGSSENITNDRVYVVLSTVRDASGVKGYGVLDTGRGLKIDFNGSLLSDFENTKMIEFEYHPGGEVSYLGNDEEQEIQIGYQGFVAINVPGDLAFKGSKKIIASQGFFEGMSEGTPWINLGVPDGAEYRIEGVTHNGLPLGVAQITAPQPINFEKLGSPDAGVDKVVLTFRIAEAGSIVTAQITLDLPAHFESPEEVVNTVKSLLDANGVLREKVEVKSQGDHLVFYLVDPGVRYLSVEETDGSGNNISYLGIGSLTGSWGSDMSYTVKESITGLGTPLSGGETIRIVASSAVTVTTSKSDFPPLYTLELVEPRFYKPITAGSTVTVNGSYTWTAPSDIATLDDLVSAWNDPANWSDGVVHAAMVKEDETHYRIAALTGAVTLSFSVSAGSTALYVLGLGSDKTDTDFVLSQSVEMNAREFAALVLAYDINRDAGAVVTARTDGSGRIIIEKAKRPFYLQFSASSRLKDAFPSVQTDTGFKAESQQDTVKALIEKVEKLYRANVKGWVKDGRLYFEDELIGDSDFDVAIHPVTEGASSAFDRFFIARDGGGEDLFDLVRDIRDAMYENINKKIIDKPSAWRTQEKNLPVQTNIYVASTGDFRGDYNTTWTVKVDVINTLSSGETVIETPGYTGFFAEREFRVFTSGFTLDGTGEIALHRSSGEEVSITDFSGLTVSGTSTDVRYRIYLEEGDVEFDSIHNVFRINGKGEIVVESPTGSEEYGIVAGYSDVKYISFDGQIEISVSNISRVTEIPEDEKSNLLVTVEDSKGRTVKKFIVTRPHKEYYVRDGVYLSFGTGQIISGDSFRMKVGSGLEKQIGRLNRAMDQVLRFRTEIGARQERLKMSENRYKVYKTEAEKKKAPLEDMDVAEATVELQKAEAALRAALLAAARLFTPTLLDFLR